MKSRNSGCLYPEDFRIRLVTGDETPHHWSQILRVHAMESPWLTPNYNIFTQTSAGKVMAMVFKNFCVDRLQAFWYFIYRKYDWYWVQSCRSGYSWGQVRLYKSPDIQSKPDPSDYYLFHNFESHLLGIGFRGNNKLNAATEACFVVQIDDCYCKGINSLT